MPYSPKGRCHAALAFLADGMRTMPELREHIAKTPDAQGYRKTWGFVGSLLDNGLIAQDQGSVWITLSGRLALQDLNEGFSWEAPRPSVRVFVQRAA